MIVVVGTIGWLGLSVGWDYRLDYWLDYWLGLLVGTIGCDYRL